MKLLVDEDGSDVVRDYISKHSVFITTQLCFAETLGALKVKLTHRLLSREKYLDACAELMAHLKEQTLEIHDIGISESSTFDDVERIASKHKLDVSDAYQLVTLNRGFFSTLHGDSKTILITADKELAAAARIEGLRVWDCLREAEPPECRT